MYIIVLEYRDIALLYTCLRRTGGNFNDHGYNRWYDCLLHQNTAVCNIFTKHKRIIENNELASIILNEHGGAADFRVLLSSLRIEFPHLLMVYYYYYTFDYNFIYCAQSALFFSTVIIHNAESFEYFIVHNTRLNVFNSGVNKHSRYVCYYYYVLLCHCVRNNVVLLY